MPIRHCRPVPQEERPAARSRAPPAALRLRSVQPIRVTPLLSDPESGEDNIPHMYLDSKDKVTVGIGTYLPAVTDAKKLRFYDRTTKKVATDEEKGADYAAVSAAAPDRAKNPGGFKARYYRQFTKLDMTPTDIGERWLSDVKAFQKQLPAYFKGFSGYPADARQALTDIAYQYGASGASKARDGKLKEAAESGDWKAAADLCAAMEGQKKRKDKRKSLFESAAKSAKP
jgi:GH24 family phage-related lysozyme (muramidase)